MNDTANARIVSPDRAEALVVSYEQIFGYARVAPAILQPADPLLSTFRARTSFFAACI